jgi:cell division protein FtsB
VTIVPKILFAAVVVLLVLSLVALGVTIWWAKTVVATCERSIDIERSNVRSLQAALNQTHEALTEMTQEVERLRAECGQTREEVQRGSREPRSADAQRPGTARQTP